MDAELDAVIDGITVDCHDEDEQSDRIRKCVL